MPSGKHKIPRDKAEKIIKKFKEIRGSGKPLPTLPDGYIFDSEDVKELLRHPHAKYFMVSYGAKEADDKGKIKEIITPILTVADSEYRTLQSTIAGADLSLKVTESLKDNGEEGGGYLDEGFPFPPPNINP